MADLSDVENAIKDTLSPVLLPNGADHNGLLDVFCRLYRGWPSPGGLNADLSAGIVNVTLFPDMLQGRTTTRFTDSWYGARAQSSLTATVAGNTITIAGTPLTGQAVGLAIDGRTYVYRVEEGDTPTLVASALAALIGANRIANYAGSTVTVPGAGTILARSVVNSSVQQEIRRQERHIRVSCWCPSPGIRDQFASAVDGVLAATTFLTLSDGTRARIVYSGTQVYDTSQNALLYRRDLTYSIEYATVLSMTAPAMLFGELIVNAGTITA